MADMAEVAGEWGQTLGGFLRNLIPQIGMARGWDDSGAPDLVQGAGELVGPAVDLWSGPKPLQEKLLRTGGALADLVAKPAALMAGHSGDAEAALRRGGDPSLTAIHQIPLGKLLPWLRNDKLPREVYSPSVALNKDGIPQDFGNVTLVMRPDALDPVRVPGTIWNRDAYTPRTAQYSGELSDRIVDDLEVHKGVAKLFTPEAYAQKREEYMRGSALNRLRDRFALDSGGLPEDVRLREGGGANLDYGHETAILSSPSMKSFKEYENNPRGAALLDPNSDPRAYVENMDEAFRGMMHTLSKQDNHLAQVIWDTFASPGAVDKRGSTFVDLASKLAPVTERELEPVNAALRSVREAYSRAPSQYGELKVRGPVRFDAPTWAGVAVSTEAEKAYPQEVRKLVELLKLRDLPTRFYSDNNSLHGQALLMSNKAGSTTGR